MMTKFISATETRMQTQDESIRGLENQVGKLAKMIANGKLGTFPSDTKKNPKEQVKEIELRSGKKLKTEQPTTEEELIDVQKGKSPNLTQSHTPISPIVIPHPFHAAIKRAKLDTQFSKFLRCL